MQFVCSVKNSLTYMMCCFGHYTICYFYAVLPFILSILQFVPIGMTGFCGRRGVIFLMLFACWCICKMKCMYLGIDCVILQELWLLIYLCRNCYDRFCWS